MLQSANGFVFWEMKRGSMEVCHGFDQVSLWRYPNNHYRVGIKQRKMTQCLVSFSGFYSATNVASQCNCLHSWVVRFIIQVLTFPCQLIWKNNRSLENKETWYPSWRPLSALVKSPLFNSTFKPLYEEELLFSPSLACQLILKVMSWYEDVNGILRFVIAFLYDLVCSLTHILCPKSTHFSLFS